MSPSTPTGRPSSTPTGNRSRRLERLRGVLGVPRFRRLLLAQLLSQGADGMYQIALAAVLIFGVDAAETPAQVTKVLAVTLLPFSLVGPFTGPFIDRFSRRSILVGASILRAILTVVLLFAIGGPEWLLLSLAVANISVNRFFHATRHAVIPVLVKRDRYLTANTVSTIVGMVFGLSGAVIGGPVADFHSPRVVVLMAAVFMTGAAVAASTIALPPGEKHGLAGIVSELRENLGDVGEGIRAIGRSPQAVYGISAIWGMRALLGFVLLASLVLLRARFDVGAAGFSLILGVLGAGNFVGATFVGPLAERFGQRGVAPFAFGLAGIAIISLGLVPTWWAILAMVFVAGIAMSTTKIASDTLIQTGLLDRYRGRAFAVYDIGYNGMFVVAALIPTLIRPFVGDAGIIVMTAIMCFVGSALLLRGRRRVPTPFHVRSYAGGRADETPREVTWDGVPIEVADVERTWHEDRAGRRVRCFRLRLADGRRVDVSGAEDAWDLDRVLP